MVHAQFPVNLPVQVQSNPLWLDVCGWSVPAGFASPAADHVQRRIDLNEHLIYNGDATYLFKVSGDSMNGIGIFPNDIPVCVGVGPTKTLAKLANFIAKRHPRSKGVFNFNNLTEEQKSRLLSQIPVEEVWGVGRKLTKRLSVHGIENAYHLREAHVPTLRAEYGVVIEKTIRELQEIQCIELEEVQPNKQQIISSRSFGNMVSELPILKDALSTFVANAAAKLRAQNSHASLIQVFLETNRFRQDLPQYNPSLMVPLPYPTNNTIEINVWAGYLVDRMFKPEFQYKKAGIKLGEITPVTHRQGDLIEPNTVSNEKLMTAIDDLNHRFGRGTLKVSTQGAFKEWQMRSAMLSPCYTTQWDSIPTV